MANTNNSAAVSAPLALARKKARFTRDGRKCYQFWGQGLGPYYAVTITIERGAKAKTAACATFVQIMNPHDDTQLFPVAGAETNDERDARIQALCAKAGATYEHGIIGWQGRGKSSANGVEKAIAVLAAMGIAVTAELGAF